MLTSFWQTLSILAFFFSVFYLLTKTTRNFIPWWKITLCSSRARWRRGLRRAGISLTDQSEFRAWFDQSDARSWIEQPRRTASAIFRWENVELLTYIHVQKGKNSRAKSLKGHRDKIFSHLIYTKMDPLLAPQSVYESFSKLDFKFKEIYILHIAVYMLT